VIIAICVIAVIVSIVFLVLLHGLFTGSEPLFAALTQNIPVKDDATFLVWTPLVVILFTVPVAVGVGTFKFLDVIFNITGA
jgi:hypothetical protein